MRKLFLPTCAVTLCLFGVGGMAQEKPLTISTGKSLLLTNNIVSGGVTVFLFYKPSSSLEEDFVREVVKLSDDTVKIRLIAMATGNEPIAKQYDITRTPTAIVLDRRRRMTGRSSDATEIRGFVRKAQRTMRIDWAEEGTELFKAADAATGSKGLRPGIMRTMSLQPEWLKQFYAMTRMSHFEDTHLTRYHKEMIATYVSALNKCKF